MRVAIDLDGTSFKWPDAFTQLALTLIAGGADVVFLTAAAGELEPKHRREEVARRISRKLPLLTKIAFFCVEERDKGTWLNSNQFDLVIDDKSITDRTCLQLAPLD